MLETIFSAMSVSVSLIRAVDYSFVSAPKRAHWYDRIYTARESHFASEFISSSRIVHFLATIFILPVTLQTFASPRKQIYPCHMYGQWHPVKGNKMF
jgi:hypothetical protein